MCCNTEQEVIKQSYQRAERDFNVRLDEQKQKMRRQMREKQTQIAEKYLKENTRLFEKYEKEKQENYPKITQFTYKIEKQKQELIIQNRKEVEQLQKREGSFKISFQLEVKTKNNILKSFISSIDYAKDINDLERIQEDWQTKSKMAEFLEFRSIGEYFGNRIQDSSDIIIQQLCEPYTISISNYIIEKRIYFCVSFYLGLFEEVIENGYNESTSEERLKKFREMMNQIAKKLYERFQNLIQAAKICYERSSKALKEDSFAPNEEKRLKDKINQLKQRNIALSQEKDRIQNENKILISKIPNYKENGQIHHVSEMISEIDHKIANKEDIEDLKRLLEEVKVGYSNEQLVQIMKDKDIKMQEMKLALAKMEKEKSKIHEEAQVEADSRKTWESKLEVKDRQIVIMNDKVSNHQLQIEKLEREVQQKAINETNLKNQNQGLRRQLEQERLKSKTNKQENSSLTLQISLLEGKIKEKDQEIFSNEQKFSKLNSEFKDKDVKISELIDSEVMAEKEKLAVMTQKISEQECALAQQQKTIAMLSKFLSESTQQRRNKQDEFTQAQSKIEKLEQTIKELQDANVIQNTEEKLASSNEQAIAKEKNLANAKFYRQNKDLKKTNSELLLKISELTKQIEHLNVTMMEEQLLFSEAELKANKAQSEMYDLGDQLRKMKNEVKRLNQSLERSKSQLQRSLQSKINSSNNQMLEQELKNANSEIQKMKKLNSDMQLEIQSLQRMKRSLQIEIGEQKKLAITLQAKLQSGYTDPTGKRYRSASFVEHKTLFISDILEKRKAEKKFLMESIETHMRREIEKTKMLYDYRRDKKVNFHEFADGHSNLVLIVETENALVASYYSGELQPNTPMEDEALIVSLDSRKVYRLNNLRNYPNKDPRDRRIIRGMVYDQYYLIFGNAEVRVRAGENKVFSNFGINNSYFNSERDRVSDLLKQGTTNEIEFINYQIHEVMFSQQYCYQAV